MKNISLTDYIKESIQMNESSIPDQALNGSSEDRKKALEKFLKGTYPDYIDKLNELLKDPKTAALLEEAFGGELGDVQLKFSKKNIPAMKLNPTQSEIDLKNSVLFPLCHPECIHNIFKPAVELLIPIVSFNDVFVIDGHHRWSQAFIFNPKCKMVSINFKGNLSATQMLKATQGVIAAWKSKHGEANQGIPSAVATPGFNIFDKNRKEMEGFLDHVFDGEIDMKGVKCDVNKVVEVLGQYIPEVKDRASLTKYICDGAEKLKNDHSPVVGAPNRGLMPQTDKAGAVGGDSAVQTMKEEPVLKVK